MNLAVAFGESVKKHPEKVALFWGEQEFRYATLHAQTRAVARHLIEGLNVQPGDRVGLWLKNRPEFVPSFLGILSAGAVVVPINNFLKPEEVHYILQDAGIDVLISENELGQHVSALETMRAGLKTMLVDEFAAFTGDAPEVGGELPGMSARGASDLAVIIYTSGTTGRPKGAMLSHGNLLHNVESCRIVLETVELDRFGVILPLFHSYMMTVGMLLPLLVGGTMVLVRSLHPPNQALRELFERRASVLPAIPQFYRALLAAAPPALPFRLCVSGAAPLPVQVLEDFEARYRIPLIEGYGLSEASPVVSKNPIHGVRKPGSIGLPIPNVEMSVQDEQGRMLGPNEVGEICVRGGNVMLGYWNKPEETAKVFRNGWLLTGDIGYRDGDGYYFITDRKKDMLLVNGINVYPREIEEVLYQFPGVRECAVVGRPDPRRGEQPVAFVAPLEGVTLEEAALVQFLRQKLADYKVPRKIHFVSSLPRNAAGKVLKTQLREMLAKQDE